MPTSSVQKYGSYEFSTTGRPQYGESAVYETNAAHGRPKRRVVRYTLTHWFLEPSFADNQARYKALKAALKVPEDVLLITDENGKVLLNKRVRVLAVELPEQWGLDLTEVKLQFEATEEITPTEFTAVFTPNGGTAVNLAGVDKWNERISAERYSHHVPERRESLLLVVASGTIRANPDDLPANRLAYLHAQKALLQACDAKDGLLVYASFSATMRVDQIECDPGDGSDELRWTLTASRLKFPAGNYAECEFEVKTKDNLEASERMTTVSGIIRAQDEAGATAKRDGLLATYAVGRMLMDSEFDAKKVDGSDGAEDTHEWTFALTFREILPGAVESWRLTIADRTDHATGLITTTYAGKVTAATSAAALAKARALGDAKYPMPVSSDEVVASVSVGGAAEQFTEVTFSYSYQRRGTERHAEVTMETAYDHFGRNTQTISGYAVADTEGNALTLARSFKASSLLTLTERESPTTAWHGAQTGALASVMQRVQFTYSYFLDPVTGTLDYMVSVTEDLDTRKKSTQWNGSARASTEGGAGALIDALIGTPTGSLMRVVKTPRYLSQEAGAAHCYQVDFSVDVVGQVATGSDDILQAEVSFESTYSVSATVITPIPYGNPYVQTAVGTLPGMVVASGTITALNLSSALTWALGQQPTGGYPDQPKIRQSPIYLEKSTSVVLRYRVDFTFCSRFPSLVMPAA